jgi:hypothetical protein
MIAELEKLTPEERDFMYLVPVMITILVAGADKKIDQAEIDEGILIAKFKTMRARQDLLDYYQVVGENFSMKIDNALKTLPKNAEERNMLLSQELERLNVILPKMEKSFASQYYASIKDIARRVAEASGGFFGYGSVSPEELKYTHLKMVNNPEG